MGFALGYGLGLRNQLAFGGAKYSEEAVSLFARMTTQPPESEKKIIDYCIRQLKIFGIWQKLDFLYCLYANSEQAARLNWIKNVHNLTKAGSGTMTFTPYSGSTGDGACWYRTNYTPSTHGVNYSRDNATFIVKTSGIYPSNCAHGAYQAAGGTILGKTGTTAVSRINSTAVSEYAEAAGYNFVSRNNPTTIESGVSREKYSTISTSSTNTTAIELFLLAYNNGSTGQYAGTQRLEFAACGAYLTKYDNYMLQSIMDYYMLNQYTFESGYVSIEFDENYENITALALPMFTSRGMTADVSVIGSKIGVLISAAQLQQLVAGGWEIKDHTYNHVTGLTITPAQRVDEVLQVNQQRIDLGLPPALHYTFPGALSNQANIDAISPYRITSTGTFDSPTLRTVIYKNTNKMKLGLFMPDNAHLTLDELKMFIDCAAVGKHWVPMAVHSVFNNTGALGGIDASKLEAILDYCLLKGVAVTSIANIYPKMV